MRFTSITVLSTVLAVSIAAFLRSIGVYLFICGWIAVMVFMASGDAIWNVIANGRLKFMLDKIKHWMVKIKTRITKHE